MNPVFGFLISVRILSDSELFCPLFFTRDVSRGSETNINLDSSTAISYSPYNFYGVG